jgi:hypothetical protein
VWFATLAEIATHVRETVDAGTYNARVVEMPFYEDGRVAPLRAGTAPDGLDIRLEARTQ